jgi:2-deoxy-D-gluconate 3-dehydrogenase
MVLASELFNVSGEVVLVTGGGTGMGLAMARALAVNGARLALAGNDPESLEAGVRPFWTWRTGYGGADGCAR